MLNMLDILNSVERKKVEAVTVGTKILMSGGEIGHHPPSSPPGPRAGAGAGAAAGSTIRAQGYASTVDIYDSGTALSHLLSENSLHF